MYFKQCAKHFTNTALIHFFDAFMKLDEEPEAMEDHLASQ